MALINYTITLDTDNETVTFTNNGTDLTGISTLDLYMRGEDKSTYEVTKEINITQFNTTGDIFTYEELFGSNPPTDNFYLCEIIGNEDDENTITYSIKLALGFTYQVAELIHNSTVGVHIPVEDLFTSMTLGAMPQVLEYLNNLSTNAAYSEDRENKWRKLYNHLKTVVNDLDY